jgi:hypothetical protein
MKRVACWKSQDAYAVVNPDADALDDFVFRAVHTDFPVQVSSGRAGSVRTVTAADFLASILQPRDHVLVPVVGDSGTGKSHLIRWLDLKLRGFSGVREVIYVPKAQTNLRDIIYSLVRRLPPKDQEPYLIALTTTGSASLTSEAQRTAILNQVHLALVNDQGGSSPSVTPDLEDFALHGLRAMFSDPHIRKILLIDNGFAAALAAHVFEKPEHYRPAEERREFRERDLPLQAGDLRKAAQETQDFLTWLMGATHADRSAVVGIVNRHIDWAISNCLNLSGDRLISLMLELRRHFRLCGQELVLLIEDFARLQGLDRALLQSILEQQPDLCVLRTVFASTGGFYESLEATIKTRVTFVVDMDAHALKDERELNYFVAHYMNAVRWGSSALREQWEDVQARAIDFDVPSKCDECSFKGECHPTFGAINGVGLYPFTAQAIEVMAERSEANYKTVFNPRAFLKLVVRPVVLSADALEAGSFPPPQLLAGLGGRLMPPAQLSRIKRDDAQHWERRIGVLELWGGTEDVINLNPMLHAAFDLPMLKGASATFDSRSVTTSPSNTSAPPTAPDSRLRELQEWQEGRTKLSTGTAQALRDAVFSAIEEFIDWDDAGLARASVCGRKGLFKPGQIGFHEQATQQSPNAIRLQIPARWDNEAERMRTTLALEGLLEVKSRGDWAFSDGVQKLACLLECLREWSQTLIEQCKASDILISGSTVSGLAFELRATLQALTNSSLTLTNDQEVLKAALVEAPATVPDFITQDLTELVNALRQVDAQSMEVIRTRYSAMKGGVPGEYIDASRLLPAAAGLRRRRFLPTERPSSGSAERREVVEPIRNVGKRIGDGLAAALLKEAAAREELKRRVDESLGERISQEAVLLCVQRVVDAAAILMVPGTPALLALKAKFEHANYGELVAALRSADSMKLDAPQLRSGVGQAGAIVDELVNMSTALIDRTSRELAGRLVAAGVEPGEKLRIAAVLQTDLEAISLQLQRYNDGNVS